MGILPIGCLDYLKRYWRRRRYQKLEDATKMKRRFKIAQFGKKTSNLGFKIVTPTEPVEKFHEVYVDTMMHLGSSKRVDNVENEAKRVAKCQPIPMLSAPTNEMVDSRVVLKCTKE
ncbi:hypothetical protein ACH5RR_036228 [Cinchona calisaya]|uniref:Uncharacterized protein n=1 Tax=Cinchona calisaya TaxID=153742 RepID=A0ABD2Y2K8_9GENT